MENRELDLERRIEKAFADSVHPGEDAIITTLPGVDHDADWAYSMLRGRTWRRLNYQLKIISNVGKMREHCQALSFISVPALKYFLPAYLIASMRQTDLLEELMDNLLFHLSGDEGQPTVRLQELSDSLSQEQKSVLVDWIRFVNDRLEEGWKSENTETLWVRFAKEGA